MCKEIGLTPGENIEHRIAGTTGYSQGIITALEISLSDSWKSFSRNSVKAVLLILSIGVRATLEFASSGMESDCLIEPTGKIRPMMTIGGLPLDLLKFILADTNKDKLESEHIAIAAVNEPKSLTISGPPELLYNFFIDLKSLSEVHPSTILNDLGQVPSEGIFSHFYRLLTTYASSQSSQSPFKELVKARFQFLQILAPFHSHHLKDTYKLIVKDLDDLGIEFSSKDIKIPLYDTFNGSNLQDYDNTTLEFSLTSRIIKLIIELPVNWDVATSKFGSKDIEDIRPGKGIYGMYEDGSRC